MENPSTEKPEQNKRTGPLLPIALFKAICEYMPLSLGKSGRYLKALIRFVMDSQVSASLSLVVSTSEIIVFCVPL
jgi:hypothetical protein